MAITGKSAKAKRTAPSATASAGPIMQPHELALSSTVQNGIGIHAWSKFLGEVDLTPLIVDLRQKIDRVVGGDMQPVEAMLFGQAMTLQTIFTSLTRKAEAQEYLKQFQVNLTLALKAQAQCRATLEALAEIKNPRPVMFAKQANVTSGPQQVNNGAVAPVSPALAEEAPNRPNELLEMQHGSFLDAGTAVAAGSVDSQVATVGKVHGAEVTGR